MFESVGFCDAAGWGPINAEQDDLSGCFQCIVLCGPLLALALFGGLYQACQLRHRSCSETSPKVLRSPVFWSFVAMLTLTLVALVGSLMHFVLGHGADADEFWKEHMYIPTQYLVIGISCAILCALVVMENSRSLKVCWVVRAYWFLCSLILIKLLQSSLMVVFKHEVALDATVLFNAILIFPAIILYCSSIWPPIAPSLVFINDEPLLVESNEESEPVRNKTDALLSPTSSHWEEKFTPTSIQSDGLWQRWLRFSSEPFADEKSTEQDTEPSQQSEVEHPVLSFLRVSNWTQSTDDMGQITVQFMVEAKTSGGELLRRYLTMEELKELRTQMQVAYFPQLHMSFTTSTQIERLRKQLNDQFQMLVRDPSNCAHIEAMLRRPQSSVDGSHEESHLTAESNINAGNRSVPVEPVCVPLVLQDLVGVSVLGWSKWKSGSGKLVVTFSVNVVTQCGSYTLHKRFSEFHQLCHQMRKQFHQLPDFPNRSMYSKKIQQEASFLDKRRGSLERFLQSVANTQAYHCQELLNFLKPDPSSDQPFSDEESEDEEDVLASVLLRKESSAISIPGPDAQQPSVNASSSVHTPRHSHTRTPNSLQSSLLIGHSVPSTSVEAVSHHRFEVVVSRWGYSRSDSLNRSHVEYEIGVKEYYSLSDYIGWTVKHRYSDFVTLHSQLKRQIGSKVPDLPSPNLFQQKLKAQPQLLAQRARELEAYLQQLINTDFFQCSTLHAFLELDNPNREMSMGRQDSRAILVMGE